MKKNPNNPNKITIELSDEGLMKLNAIKEKYLLSYSTEAVKMCIFGAYRDLFEKPQFVARSGRPALTEEELRDKGTKTYHQKKEIVQQAKLEKLIEIAASPYPLGLSGTVSADKKAVTYYTYFERGRDEHVILLREVNQGLIDVQYQPSYDEIMRLQKEGKVDYDTTPPHPGIKID